MTVPPSRPRRRKPLDAGPFTPEIESFRLHLAAEGKAPKTVRTYTEAVAWFAAAHLISRTSHTLCSPCPSGPPANARAALEEMLGSGHQVFLCTSPVIGSRWCAQEKLAWIEHHLGRTGCAGPSSPRIRPRWETGCSRASWLTTGPGSRERRSHSGGMCSLTLRRVIEPVLAAQ
jgi:hypothetical protein